MNKRVFEHMVEYLEPKAEVPVDKVAIVEAILDADVIHQEVRAKYRWWHETFNVVQLGGMHIGYRGAIATGHACLRDLGWYFDPNSIVEVVPVERTVIQYEVVKA